MPERGAGFVPDEYVESAPESHQPPEPPIAAEPVREAPPAVNEAEALVRQLQGEGQKQSEGRFTKDIARETGLAMKEAGSAEGALSYAGYRLIKSTLTPLIGEMQDLKELSQKQALDAEQQQRLSDLLPTARAWELTLGPLAKKLDASLLQRPDILNSYASLWDRKDERKERLENKRSRSEDHLINGLPLILLTDDLSYLIRNASSAQGEFDEAAYDAQRAYVRHCGDLFTKLPWNHRSEFMKMIVEKPELSGEFDDLADGSSRLPLLEQIGVSHARESTLEETLENKVRKSWERSWEQFDALLKNSELGPYLEAIQQLDAMDNGRGNIKLRPQDYERELEDKRPFLVMRVGDFALESAPDKDRRPAATLGRIRELNTKMKELRLSMDVNPMSVLGFREHRSTESLKERRPKSGSIFLGNEYLMSKRPDIFLNGNVFDLSRKKEEYGERPTYLGDSDYVIVRNNNSERA